MENGTVTVGDIISTINKELDKYWEDEVKTHRFLLSMVINKAFESFGINDSAFTFDTAQQGVCFGEVVFLTLKRKKLFISFGSRTVLSYRSVGLDSRLINVTSDTSIVSLKKAIQTEQDRIKKNIISAERAIEKSKDNFTSSFESFVNSYNLSHKDFLLMEKFFASLSSLENPHLLQWKTDAVKSVWGEGNV